MGKVLKRNNQRKKQTMKRVIFITFAYFCANALCQEQEIVGETANDRNRPTMLSMLSKYIELNRTIDEVMQGSMTESYGGVWLNATARPSGLCEIEETYDEEVTITDRIPYKVEVDVWCWPEIRCSEYETHYREEKRKQNVTKTRFVSAVQRSDLLLESSR